MGARCVFRWVPAPGQQPQAAWEAIIAAVQGLTGTGSSTRKNWTAICSALKQISQDDTAKPRGAVASPAAGAKDLYSVVFRDLPSTLHLVLRHERCVISTDRGITFLLDKLNMYSKRLTLAFEGWQYPCGDFTIRPARAVQKPNEEFRGHILDIEYGPAPTLGAGEAILKEFASILEAAIQRAGPGGGRLEAVPVPLPEFLLPERFGAQHSAIQYIFLCGLLLARPAAAPT